ncbi:MAG: hypothetical protein NC241_02915 [Bacteroides sp.]|nr:hypothetical protein [Bacteroides sp.]MCM1456395.1 hypothetical protein [Lachnoclostridium sp.]
MSALQGIYDRIPVWVQNIFVTGKGIVNYYHRYGKEYWRYREYFEEFDKLTVEQKCEAQLSMLKEFLLFAVENSKFYARLYEDVDLAGIKTIDDLKRLPIVDKEMLRENIDDVVTTHDNCTHSNTGGTTGKSLTVVLRNDDSKKRMAMLDHFKSRVGFEHLKMRRATFNGKHIVPPRQKSKIFWRYNWTCKQMIFSSFHITEENIKYYVEELNRFKPHAIDGFFTSMCDVANYMKRHGLKAKFRPVAIFPTSETLTDEGRTLLEEVFGCPVYDQYASSEGAPFVTEWPDRKKRMELSTGVFEHLDGTNEILVTSFTTHGTPLIRYRIGDAMEWDEDGLQDDISPVVKSIQGRKLDFLYSAEGAKINAGNVSNLLKYLPNVVIRAQFVQETMDEVTALLEVDKSKFKPEHENALRKEFMQKFGPNTRFVIKIVDSIPRERSGKFRMIKNNVK